MTQEHNQEIDFPDLHHFLKIRERLWCGREFGQAAVMVGAGFSRNTIKANSTVPDLPLWGELANKMKQELPGAEGIKDALELASKYEQEFGRQLLDKLLLDSIPDSQHYPSELHETLLKLPWSDVFTTNYDTLLERTRPSIHERKYDLVYTPADIPGKMKPRIVKLHGSFPAHRPFIITQEDYQSYSRKFAPFVNLVQQSIMENAFCLIGFSGDDPNFLQWIEWVRDNLGEYAPPIYLCGVFNFSNEWQEELKKRKITIVNLAPLFPRERYTNRNLRHSKALEWFLKSLNNQKKSTPSNWHSLNRTNSSQQSKDLPKLIEPTPNLAWNDSDLIRSPFSSDRISTACKNLRLDYPGWLICPPGKRYIIWLRTEKWIDKILREILVPDKLDTLERLFLIYESIWRLDKSLIPLISLVNDEKIESIINEFNPYPKEDIEDKIIKSAKIKPDCEQYQQLDWSEIRKAWVAINFALVQTARLNQDEKKFEKLIKRLERIVQLDTEWHGKWLYEQCLFYLYRLDEVKVREILASWPESDHLAFWEVKRASILAELGDLGDAEKIAEAALAKIRSSFQPYKENYYLLSQEGVAILVLRHIHQATEFFDSEFEEKDQEYRDRLAELEKYDCNIFDDIKILALKVAQSPPKPKPKKQVTNKYFPGEKQTTYSYSFVSESVTLQDLYPAFQSIILLEEAGIAPIYGFVILDRKLDNAALWIRHGFPRWSISWLIRKNSKLVEKWLDFNTVASLNLEHIDYLYQICFKSLQQSMELIKKEKSRISLSYRLIQIIPKVLGRICWRLCDERKNKLFGLAIKMYSDPILRDYQSDNEALLEFFQGLFYGLYSATKILPFIPQLLSLPIPQENRGDWVSSFCKNRCSDNFKIDPQFDRSSWAIPIKRLIEMVEHGSQQERTVAISRLDVIDNINGLKNEEKEKFSQALWSRIDETTKLPKDTLFYKYAFLSLPEPGRAKENFRNYLLSKHFTNLSIASKALTRLLIEWLRGSIIIYNEDEENSDKFVDWNQDEATQLLNNLIKWWKQQKEEDLFKEFLTKNDDLIFLKSDSENNLHFENNLNYLVQLISQVILPRLTDSDEETKNRARKLIDELEEAGFCLLYALPMTLFVAPDSGEAIVRKLGKGLVSVKSEEVIESIDGLYNWLLYSEKQMLPPPPMDLLDKLVRVVRLRQPSFNEAIDRVTEIIKRFPHLFNQRQLEYLLITLEYLLEETRVLSWDELHEINEKNLTIAMGDRFEYRILASQLAYQLLKLFEAENKDIPDIIKQWQEASENDILPEIKAIWE